MASCGGCPSRCARANSFVSRSQITKNVGTPTPNASLYLAHLVTRRA